MRLVKHVQYKQSEYVPGDTTSAVLLLHETCKQSSTPSQDPLRGSQESSTGIAATNDGEY